MALVSEDGIVKVWDIGSGACLQTFERYYYELVALLLDLAQVALVSCNTIEIWDASGGRERLQRLEGHASSIILIAFSHDLKQLVSGSADGII